MNIKRRDYVAGFCLFVVVVVSRVDSGGRKFPEISFFSHWGGRGHPSSCQRSLTAAFLHFNESRESKVGEKRPFFFVLFVCFYGLSSLVCWQSLHGVKQASIKFHTILIPVAHSQFVPDQLKQRRHFYFPNERITIILDKWQYLFCNTMSTPPKINKLQLTATLFLSCQPKQLLGPKMIAPMDGFRKAMREWANAGLQLCGALVLECFLRDWRHKFSFFFSKFKRRGAGDEDLSIPFAWK